VIDRTFGLKRRLSLHVTWGGFSNWAIWPALMVGVYRAGGWVNLFWLQGRVGVSWRAKRP
jgi:hypothetical protein